MAIMPGYSSDSISYKIESDFSEMGSGYIKDKAPNLITLSPSAEKYRQNLINQNPGFASEYSITWQDYYPADVGDRVIISPSGGMMAVYPSIWSSPGSTAAKVPYVLNGPLAPPKILSNGMRQPIFGSANVSTTYMLSSSAGRGLEESVINNTFYRAGPFFFSAPDSSWGSIYYADSPSESPAMFSAEIRTVVASLLNDVFVIARINASATQPLGRSLPEWLDGFFLNPGTVVTNPITSFSYLSYYGTFELITRVSVGPSHIPYHGIYQSFNYHHTNFLPGEILLQFNSLSGESAVPNVTNTLNIPYLPFVDGMGVQRNILLQLPHDTHIVESTNDLIKANLAVYGSYAAPSGVVTVPTGYINPRMQPTFIEWEHANNTGLGSDTGWKIGGIY